MVSVAERHPMATEAEVVAALRGEERLLALLDAALTAQRTGIATVDIPAVDTATRSVSMLIHTLDDARRHRQDLAGELARNDDEYEGIPPTRPALIEAREAVRRGAERVARELAVNQRILVRALKAGDEYLQALFASVAAPATTYTESRDAVHARPSGVVVNATA